MEYRSNADINTLYTIRMKTVIDKCHTIFLDRIEYMNSLKITVSEGILQKELKEITIGNKTINNLREVVLTHNSCQFEIEFKNSGIINFQLTDEIYSSFDENETRDTEGFIQIIKNSKYLNYIEVSHGWYKEILDKEAQHYRIWTSDDVIDVISIEEPNIQEINPPKTFNTE